MKTRLVLLAAAWATVAVLVMGSAQAQSPTSPSGQFVLVGVVVLEGGRGLAFLQEPNVTSNKVTTVGLGDSVGPYRVTKILTHLVELTGPGGVVSIPLAGLPGAVNVASSAGTAVRPAVEMGPHPSLSNPNVISTPRGDPRRNYPTATLVFDPAVPPSPGFGPYAFGGVQSQASQQQAQPRAAATSVGANTAVAGSQGNPSKHFPIMSMFNGM